MFWTTLLSLMPTVDQSKQLVLFVLTILVLLALLIFFL